MSKINAFIDWLIGNEKPTLCWLGAIFIAGETIFLTSIF